MGLSCILPSFFFFPLHLSMRSHLFRHFMHPLSQVRSTEGRNECQGSVKSSVYWYPLVRWSTWEPCSDFLKKMSRWLRWTGPPYLWLCHINHNDISTVSSSMWNQMTLAFRTSQSIEKYKHLIFRSPAVSLTAVFYVLLSELLSNPWGIAVHDGNSLCCVWLGEGLWQAEPVQKNI